MNDAIFYSLAEVSMALAGFSGIAAAFRLRGKNAWSAIELRVLWFLIIDSFLVVFLSFLPVLLFLGGVAEEMIWAICSIMLGAWFVLGNFLGFRDNRRRHVIKRVSRVPLIAFLFNIVMVVALIVAACLWLSAFDVLIPRGQAVYVGGLVVLMAFAVIEFLFFIGRAAPGQPKR